jgi:hypothetical protein
MSSQLVRVSAAANGVPQQQARARGHRGQHEHRVKGGDRDPVSRAEPGCGEGPGGNTLPRPPPGDTQRNPSHNLDDHQQRDQFAQGCGAAGHPGRDDERGRVPGDDQQRGQRDLRPHARDEQAATQVSDNGPGGAGRPRPAVASGDSHDQRGAPGYARDAGQNIRQRGPNR